MDIRLSEITEYMQQIDKLVEEKLAKRLESLPEDPYQSPMVNELVAALAKAQTEYPQIGQNRLNPYFKTEYADYDVIMCVIRPLLAKNGLTLFQFTKLISPSNERILHTQLYHSSGQWKETRERIIPEKNDDQKWACTITFKKRHQAMALLNITIDKDRYDDDAEANVQESRKAELNGTDINHNYQPQDQPYATINAHQYGELSSILKGWPDIADAVMRRYKISALADLPSAQYDYVKTQVNANIENRKKGSKAAAN